MILHLHLVNVPLTVLNGSASHPDVPEKAAVRISIILQA